MIPYLLPFLSSLLLLLTFHNPIANVQAQPLRTVCDNTANYTSNSTFGNNLKLLFPSLSSNAALNNGFSNTTIGQNQDTVYGLALCRGDVPPSDCRDCINTAGAQILSNCPSRSSIIWYGNCLLRYSNQNFFGSPNNPIQFYISNPNNVTDPVQFNTSLGVLMGDLSNKAAYEPRNRMFATGEAKIPNSYTIYGLVQCTRDISATNCQRCIDGAISQIPTCCGGKEGGRVIGYLCYINFEVFRFFGASTIAAPAPSPPPTIPLLPAPAPSPASTIPLLPPSTNTSPLTNGTTTGTGEHLLLQNSAGLIAGIFQSN